MRTSHCFVPFGIANTCLAALRPTTFGRHRRRQHGTLPCSGKVADAAYFNKLERDSVSQDSFRELHGVVAYIRYRGDTLLVHSGSGAQLRALIGMIQELSTVFKLEVESIASDEVQMLEVVFYHSPQWRSTGIWTIESILSNRIPLRVPPVTRGGGRGRRTLSFYVRGGSWVQSA